MTSHNNNDALRLQKLLLESTRGPKYYFERVNFNFQQRPLSRRKNLLSNADAPYIRFVRVHSIFRSDIYTQPENLVAAKKYQQRLYLRFTQSALFVFNRNEHGGPPFRQTPRRQIVRLLAACRQVLRAHYYIHLYTKYTDNAFCLLCTNVEYIAHAHCTCITHLLFA